MIIKNAIELEAGDVVTYVGSNTSYLVSSIGFGIAYFDGVKCGQNLNMVQYNINWGIVEVTRGTA